MISNARGTPVEWTGLAATSQPVTQVSSMLIPRYANGMDNNPGEER